MDRADSAVSGALQRLTPPPVLLAVLAWSVAGVIALLVARALRTRTARAAGSLPPPVHWLHRSLRGAVILAPFLAAVAVLLGSHVALAALGGSTEVIDGAVRIVGALVLVRLAGFALGLTLGPESWVGARESRITLILWTVAAVAMLGWLDALEAALNRISLLPGRTTLSVWGLLKGLVVVTAFVIVASLVARAIERHVMKLDQLAVSTRVGVSKFTYFLLLGLGGLLGVNAAGAEPTPLNLPPGATGLAPGSRR